MTWPDALVMITMILSPVITIALIMWFVIKYDD